MNRNFKTSSMTEAAMISGILVIFAYISWFLVPSLMFFYPIPAIILAKRKGFKYSVLSLIAAGLIISMILGIQTGINFLILFTPFGIALSYGVCKDEDPYKTILISGITFMVSFVIMILITQAIVGINFIHQMSEMVDQTVIMYKEFMNKTAVNIDAQKLSNAIKKIDDMSIIMKYTLKHLFPALLIVSSIITAALDYFVVSKLSNRFRIDVRKTEGLSFFSFPRTFIIAMAGLLLMSFLLKVFKYNVQVIQMNIFMISFFAMFLQGFSVLKFYLLKANINKVARILILITAIWIPEAGIMLAIVGIIDLIFDLRKIKHKVV